MSTTEHWIPDGIVGVTGTEPVGAALTIGIKDRAKGFPIEKDRLHIMEPHEGPDGRRAPHPSFGWWNGAPPEKRKVVRGIIAHASWGACLQQHYLCYRGKGLAVPPSNRPACRGDGNEAERFIGEKGDNDWRRIPCPGEACQYRNAEKGPAACKPTTRFLFRIDWSHSPELVDRYNPPTPIVRFSSGGWHTYRSILGLKQSLDKAAAAMGLESYSPIGYRFTFQLTEGTSKKDGGRRFPKIEVSPDESAIDFLVRSQQMRRMVQGHQVARLTDDTLAADARLIEGPRGGGQ